MNKVRAYSLRIHENAELSCVEFEDRLDLKLINKITGKTSEKSYYKLDKGIDAFEAGKIDTIIYFMHSEIGLNLWDTGIKREDVMDGVVFRKP